MTIKRISRDDHVDGVLVNLGNVGVGTTSPSAALDVVGAGKFSNGLTVSGGGMAIGTTIDNDVPLKIGTVSATGQIGLHLASETGAHLQLTDTGNVDMSIGVLDGQSGLSFHTGRNRQSAGTELMRLTSGGNVGIGTTSPGAALDVAGTARATNFIPSGLTGATTAVRIVGGTTSAPPATGTFVAGDVVIGTSGAIYICTTGGSPGNWATVGSGAATVFSKSFLLMGG